MKPPATWDVVVAGAGPAGSIASLLLARAGARVLLIDRETFPRDKLCGDTVNPGCLRFLATLGLSGGILERGRALVGMLVSGPSRQQRAEYGPGIEGKLIRRKDLDLWLLERAIAAGVRFESGLRARDVLASSGQTGRMVNGLVVAQRRSSQVSALPARIVIAADGVHSAIARAAGLVVLHRAARRWAFGVYATGVAGLSNVGEMHVRSHAYIGIAPFDETLANVCVVTQGSPRAVRPLNVIRSAIDGDGSLRARFASARFVERPRVLGPLAADRGNVGLEGLLLAGDAAGFVDPMTGDGLHLAARGAALAADAARYALETGDRTGAVTRLAESRTRVLSRKIRFNRLIRRVSQSQAAISLIATGAIVAPSMFRRVVCYAGDAA
jgi:flavin-dependent dehydrogenase